MRNSAMGMPAASSVVPAGTSVALGRGWEVGFTAFGWEVGFAGRSSGGWEVGFAERGWEVG